MNGPSNSSVADDELRRRLELQDEEVKLYKDKYEECNKQLLQAVYSCPEFIVVFYTSSVGSYFLSELIDADILL